LSRSSCAIRISLLAGTAPSLFEGSRGACRYLIAATIADAKPLQGAGPDRDEMVISRLAGNTPGTAAFSSQTLDSRPGDDRKVIPTESWFKKKDGMPLFPFLQQDKRSTKEVPGLKTPTPWEGRRATLRLWV
jgi:hypothetical protein